MRGCCALVGLVGTVGLALVGRSALATDCSRIESSCINDDALWPHAGPSQFESIGDPRTLAPGHLGFAFVTSYLSRPIVLDVKAPGGAGSTQNAIDNQANGTFLWAYGVGDRLELELGLPITFGQSGAGLSPVTGGQGLKDTAVRDLRFGFAYAIVPRPRVADDAPPTAGPGRIWALGARFEVSAPDGDRSQFAGERSAVFVPSLAADYRRDRWFAGAEIGARVRPVTQLLQARLGTQLVAAVGIGAGLLPRELLSLAVEGWMLPTFVEQAEIVTDAGAYASRPKSGTLVPAEWQVSARSAPLPGGDLSIQIGGGGSIPFESESALTTPRFRFVVSLRWAPLGRDSDGDGVPDAADRCVFLAAPGSANGCPAGASPTEHP